MRKPTFPRYFVFVLLYQPAVAECCLACRASHAHRVVWSVGVVHFVPEDSPELLWSNTLVWSPVGATMATSTSQTVTSTPKRSGWFRLSPRLKVSMSAHEG